LLKFADTGISNLGQILKNCFSPNHQEILGTFSVNSLDRLSATNGQDLSLYATLLKPINLLKFADTGISNLGQILNNFFFPPYHREML
jgi:hypothetical protein